MAFTVLRALTLSALFVLSSAQSCPPVLTTYAQAVDFSSLKLKVFGFEPLIRYIEGPSAGLKILGATSAPFVTLSSSGVEIAATSTCTTVPPSSGASPLNTGMLCTALSMMYAPRAAAPVLALLLLAQMGLPMASAQYGTSPTTKKVVSSPTSAPVASVQESCTATLELEITLPPGATTNLPTPPNFGLTDHYLEANSSTVRWGVFDLSAPAMLTMKSGETVTVEVITHHSGHDYAKMIRGDPAVEGIFCWNAGKTMMDKCVPKTPGAGVHLITGPVAIEGAMPGDVLQVEILELDPRPNPDTGKTYGTNSAKFAGYQFRVGHRDGTPYTESGGHEAITVFEFEKTVGGKMAWAKPVYMYTVPSTRDPAGKNYTSDREPSMMFPHKFNYGPNMTKLDGDVEIVYPAGFDGMTIVNDGNGKAGVIDYLEADLNWKVPLRPHLGTMAVMPANTNNYGANGANTIPPSKFGGNVDDWRIGKGGTMYYTVEVAGGHLVVGDTHAAQGDTELAGTAMETSMTAKLKVTLHKAGSLPKFVQNLNFPLLETAEQFVIHGFAYTDFLAELTVPSSIFQVGASVDRALMDAFNKTRIFIMDVYELTEEETIALMGTGVDFGITQIVDGNWGVHADIDKWMFEAKGAYTEYDYKCTPSGRKRMLLSEDGFEVDSRRKLLDDNGVVAEIEDVISSIWEKVSSSCTSCANNVKPEYKVVAEKMLDAKLKASMKLSQEKVPPQVKAALEKGGKRRTSADLTEFKMVHAKDQLKAKLLPV